MSHKSDLHNSHNSKLSLYQHYGGVVSITGSTIFNILPWRMAEVVVYRGRPRRLDPALDFAERLKSFYSVVNQWWDNLRK